MLHWKPRLVALVAVLALVLIALGGLAEDAHLTTCTGKRADDTTASCRRRASLRHRCRSAPPASASRAPPRFRSRSRRTRRRRCVGLAALLAASTLADRFPVPVEGIDTGGVSLSFVFGVASIVLFGWAAGLFVVCLAPAITQVLEQRPADPHRLQRLGLRARRDRGRGGLVAAARRRRGRRARPRRRGRLGAVRGQPDPDHRRRRGQRAPLALLAGAHEHPLTVVPFSLMASAALMLVVLWERSPFLSVALVGPLLAIQLYQRAIVGALRAMRLALTDPLTGLGNHRHFHERLERELRHAQEKASPAHSLPRRRRRLQADQRPLRPPGRRPRPLAARVAPAPDAARRSGSAATSSRCCCPATTRAAR